MNPPFSAGQEIARGDFKEVRLRTIFECSKWDPQVGDTSVLAAFPVLLSRRAWQELATTAEELARETIAAEREILNRPEWLKQLGLPRGIWKLLAGAHWDAWPDRPRVMRFDFHFTTEGWRISEVNSDVPGGFIEAGGFTSLMAQACGQESTGNPATAVAASLVRGGESPAPTVAMVHASAYSDDRQVAAYLGAEVEKLGGKPVLVDPSQLRWNGSRTFADAEWCKSEVHAIYRFFPAEWLPNLRRSCSWPRYFEAASLRQCNPGAALVSQSKRFGLLIPKLRTPMPRWRELLPETREVQGLAPAEWVFKPALGRVGEGILFQGVTAEKERREIQRNMFFFPGHWIAQRRFDSVPVETPAGPRHLCFGVYTVDGRAAGTYARSSSSRIIDQGAADLAVLLKD